MIEGRKIIAKLESNVYYITYKLQSELRFEAILLSAWNRRQGLHEPRNEPLDFQRLLGP